MRGTWDPCLRLTAEAIRVEASEVGRASAIPTALLFGVLLGMLYDCFFVGRTLIGRTAFSGGSHRTARLLAKRPRPLFSPKPGEVISPIPKERAEEETPSDPAADMVTDAVCREAPTDGAVSAASEHTRQKKGEGRHGKKGKHPDPVLFLLDLLYMLLGGILSAVFIYWANFGILRWYLVVSALLGFCAYRSTLHVLFVGAVRLIYAWVRATLIVLYDHTLRYVFMGGCFVWRKLTKNRKRRPRSSHGRRSSSSSSSAASPSFACPPRSTTEKRRSPWRKSRLRPLRRRLKP